MIWFYQSTVAIVKQLDGSWTDRCAFSMPLHTLLLISVSMSLTGMSGRSSLLLHGIATAANGIVREVVAAASPCMVAS
jgi:hypothetical protein